MKMAILTIVSVAAVVLATAISDDLVRKKQTGEKLYVMARNSGRGVWPAIALRV